MKGRLSHLTDFATTICRSNGFKFAIGQVFFRDCHCGETYSPEQASCVWGCIGRTTAAITSSGWSLAIVAHWLPIRAGGFRFCQCRAIRTSASGYPPVSTDGVS